MERTLEDWAQLAQQGDQAALEMVLCAIQDRVYGLALRMLWYPADAEDASQELLIKVMTHLSSFRRDSSFLTWVYHIACNHLLTKRTMPKQRRRPLSNSMRSLRRDFSRRVPGGRNQNWLYYGDAALPGSRG